MLYRLTVRNIKMFMRDKTSVFFSLLSMLIIIGLYALFLGQMNVNSVQSVVGDGVAGVRFLVDSWIMAGIVIVNTITVTLGVFGIMVDDEAKKRLSGFLVAPIKRGKLVAGYLFSSWVVGILMSVLSLAVAELYIVASGGQLLSLMAMLKALGLVVVSVFSGSSIVFFLISFIHTAGGFATLSTLLGTVIGFITGIYLPIGLLPDAVQTVIKFVPATHLTALMRSVFLEVPLSTVFEKAPAEALTHFQQMYGITIFAGEETLTAPVMIGYTLVVGLVFLGLSIYRMSRRKI